MFCTNKINKKIKCSTIVLFCSVVVGQKHSYFINIRCICLSKPCTYILKVYHDRCTHVPLDLFSFWMIATKIQMSQSHWSFHIASSYSSLNDLGIGILPVWTNVLCLYLSIVVYWNKGILPELLSCAFKCQRNSD